jgi:hypothetical protein
VTIDDRLRSGLGARPELTDSEIEGKLAVTIQRGRRRRTLRRAGLVVIGGVIALGLLVALPKLLTVSNRKEPVGPPSPSIGAHTPSPIVGTYTLVLGPRDPGAQRSHAVGRWVLTFKDDGSVSLQRGNAVSTGRYRFASSSIVISGLLDACQGTGSGEYSWLISQGTLRFFAPSTDPCRVRRFLLLGPGHGHSWVANSSP